MKRLLLLLICAPAFAANYYVANSGSDGNPGTSALPFATIGKVNATAASCDTVNFKGGDTFDDAVLASVSGTSTCQTTYTSYGTGNAVLSGGVLITGAWTNVSGNIWSTPFSHTLGKPREVWVNGTRCIRAKTATGLPSGSTLIGGGTAHAVVASPTSLTVAIESGGIGYTSPPSVTLYGFNLGSVGTHGTPVVTLNGSGTITSITVPSVSGYTTGDFLFMYISSEGYSTAASVTPGYLSTYANQSDIEFIYRTGAWFESRVPMSSVSGNIITMVSPAIGNMDVVHHTQATLQPTNIENAYEIFAANAANGTFYHNRTTDTLYLIAPGGANPNGMTVRVPVREVIVNAAANFTTFSNLTISHSTLLQASTSQGYANLQGSSFFLDDGTINRLGGAFLITGHNINLRNVSVNAMGGSGIDVSGTASSIDIAGGTFTDLSCSAIVVGKVTGGSDFSTSPSMVNIHSTTVSNTGLEYSGCEGIMQYIAGSTHIHHNVVHDTTYSGISVGFGGNYYINPTSGSSNTRIHHNLVYNAMQLMNDGAGIYLTSRTSHVVVDHNLVHDIGTGGPKQDMEGIYMDEQSQDVLEDSNVLYTIRNGNTSVTNFNNAVDQMVYSSNIYDVGTFLGYNPGVSTVTPPCAPPGFVAAGSCPSPQPPDNVAVGLPAAITAGAALGAGLEASMANPYSYSKTLTIQSGKVGGADLQNFPVLICDTDPDLKTIANGGKVTNTSGYDIVLSMDPLANYLLDFEIESYSPTTGKYCTWMRDSRAESTFNQVLYRHYGNPAVSTFQATPSFTWDKYYAFVQHMNTIGADSTTNKITFTNNGGAVTTASGKIAGAVTFNGTSQYLDYQTFPPLIPGTSSQVRYTIQAFSKPTTLTPIGEMFSFGQALGSGAAMDLTQDAVNGNIDLIHVIEVPLHRVTAVSTATSVVGTWTNSVGTYDGANISIYTNGVFKSSIAATTLGWYSSVGFHNFIGANGSDCTCNFFPGDLDELRLSKIARSSNWITGDNNTESDPSTFYVRGAEILNSFFLPAIINNPVRVN